MSTPSTVIVHLRWSLQFAQDVIAGLLASETNPRLELIVVNGDQPLEEGTVEAVRPGAVVGDSHYRGSISLCNKRRIPFVDLTGSANIAGLHTILPDDTKIGRMAADYFREAGLVNFAYIGYSDQAYSARREAAFREALDGADVPAYHSPLSPYLLGGKEPELLKFLKGLPCPCGIFACSDLRALAVYHNLKRVGRRIPEDLLVLGVDVDLVLRRITGHVMPSIDQAAWFQGWQAGQLISRLIRNPRLRPAVIRMTPIQIVDSPDLHFPVQEQPATRQFLNSLHKHANRADGLARAFAETPLSRRSVEAATRLALGASPLQLLHRIRLRTALSLLADPALTLAEAAGRCGFEYQGDFSRFIRKALGVPPGVVRKGLLSKGRNVTRK